MQDRDRRALFILGPAVGLYLILQFDFFAPSAGSGPGVSQGSLAVLEQRLQTAQVEARQRPLTVAELEAANTHLERLEQGLLESPDPALAQAEMQTLVGALLTAEGIPMRSSRFGTVELEQEHYARVPLVVDFSCGIEQVVNLMAAAANASRLLTTREIRVRPDKPDVKSVRVQMTISGYLPVERAPELAAKAKSNPAGLL